ncbi:MAG TPA: hypothetical protein VIF11_11755 [Methylomirabilota bacterium]|jgi:hypothetical protein
MNSIERMLADDLGLLIDRLAASVPAGSLERIRAMPTVASRLDDVEARLAAARTVMVEAYGGWTRTLDDLENLWALATLRSTAGEPAEGVARLAA